MMLQQLTNTSASGLYLLTATQSSVLQSYFMTKNKKLARIHDAGSTMLEFSTTLDGVCVTTINSYQANNSDVLVN